MYEVLQPTIEPARRSVTLDAVKSMLLGTSSPKFGEQCTVFINSFIVGDEVIEYCSGLQDWRRGFGRSGFQLVRNGEIVAELLTSIS